MRYQSKPKAKKKQTPNVFLPKGSNPSGYRVDITHPDVSERYEAYKREHHIIGAMSDAERADFEGPFFREAAAEFLNNNKTA